MPEAERSPSPNSLRSDTPTFPARQTQRAHHWQFAGRNNGLGTQRSNPGNGPQPVEAERRIYEARSRGNLYK